MIGSGAWVPERLSGLRGDILGGWNVCCAIAWSGLLPWLEAGLSGLGWFYWTWQLDDIRSSSTRMPLMLLPARLVKVVAEPAPWRGSARGSIGRCPAPSAAACGTARSAALGMALCSGSLGVAGRRSVRESHFVSCACAGRSTRTPAWPPSLLAGRLLVRLVRSTASSGAFAVAAWHSQAFHRTAEL